MQNNLVRWLVVPFFFLSGVSPVVAGTIYKCKNQQGILVYQNSECKQDAETVKSWEHKDKPAPVPVADDDKAKENKKDTQVLKLKQNANGHFTTDGSVDGKSLNFVVDTGASYVSLPESAAHEANIYCDTNVKMATANGNTDGCTVKIKELKFGPYVIKEVAAVVVPNLGQPLMGMNVLQLFKIEQGKGEMHISILESTKTEEAENKQDNDQAASK